MDVGVDWKRWDIKGLGHDNRSRFVAHARKGFKGFKGSRDFAIVPFDEQFRKPLDVLGFGGSQSNLANVGENGVHFQGGHGFGRAGFGKQGGSDLIHLQIGGLGTHEDGDQQLERIAVVEWNGNDRVEFLELLGDDVGLVLPLHNTTHPS